MLWRSCRSLLWSISTIQIPPRTWPKFAKIAKTTKVGVRDHSFSMSGTSHVIATNKTRSRSSAMTLTITRSVSIKSYKWSTNATLSYNCQTCKVSSRIWPASTTSPRQWSAANSKKNSSKFRAWVGKRSFQKDWSSICLAQSTAEKT